MKRIDADLCTLACTPTGLQIIDTVPGLSHAELEQLVGLPIRAATDWVNEDFFVTTPDPFGLSLSKPGRAR